MERWKYASCNRPSYIKSTQNFKTFSVTLDNRQGQRALKKWQCRFLLTKSNFTDSSSASDSILQLSETGLEYLVDLKTFCNDIFEYSYHKKTGRFTIFHEFSAFFEQSLKEGLRIHGKSRKTAEQSSN